VLSNSRIYFASREGWSVSFAPDLHSQPTPGETFKHSSLFVKASLRHIRRGLSISNVRNTCAELVQQWKALGETFRAVWVRCRFFVLVDFFLSVVVHYLTAVNLRHRDERKDITLFQPTVGAIARLLIQTTKYPASSVPLLYSRKI